MLLILILIILLLMLMFFNFLHQKDFISPVFLGLLSFLFASILIAMNEENWMININSNFFAIVIIASLSLILGSYIIRLTKRNYALNSEAFHKYNAKVNNNIYSKLINVYPAKLVLFISIILFILFVVMLFKAVGISGGLSETLRRIYESKFATEGGHFLFHQVEKMIIAIAYISYFHVMNVVFFGNKKKISKIIISLIPVGLALICVILSTDRNIILRYFIYVLALWILFFQRSPRRKLKKSNRIILASTIIVAVVMLLAFYGLGKMKQYTSNLERMVGIYGGSGLYNFNLYIANNNITHTYGLATFKSILNVFATFGLVDSSLIIDEVGFITYASSNGYVYSSNIYSTLQPFYQDFGIFGVIIFMCFVGFCLEFLYQKTYKYKFGFVWILYSSLIYPTIFFSIADQFYSRIHLGLLYEIFWLCVVFYLTYGRLVIKYKKYQKRQLLYKKYQKRQLLYKKYKMEANI